MIQEINYTTIYRDISMENLDNIQDDGTNRFCEKNSILILERTYEK